MKSILVSMLVGAFGLFLAIDDAEAARRLGGGSNVGRQRQSITPQHATPQPASPSQAIPRPAQPAPAGGRSWLGPLAGLAAGGLLGAMLFGHGFDGLKMMDIVMVLLLAGAIFFVYRMLRRPSATAAPAPRRTIEYASMPAEPAPRTEPVIGRGLDSPEPQPVATFPAGFDAEGFARHAKTNFMRLQAANDSKDLAAMRDFMTPELYAEIAAQLNARGNEPQHTEVVKLDADVLDVITDGDDYVASVRFSGAIKESADQPAEPFAEIWHLQKPVNGRSGWLIAGIQQA
jgi:predicted lipid-binding transport protein (Tim44 family)